MKMLLLLLTLLVNVEKPVEQPNEILIFSDNYVKVAKDLWYPADRAEKEHLKPIGRMTIHYIIERTSRNPDEGKLRRIRIKDPKTSQEISDKEIFNFWQNNNKPKDFFNYVKKRS